MPFAFTQTEEDLSPSSAIDFSTSIATGGTNAKSLVSKQTDWGIPTTIAGVGSLGVVDLADTVVSSIPGMSSITGLERGDLNNKVLSMVGMPGLNSFYNDHRDAIEVTSGIYGAVGSQLIANGLGRALAPAFQSLSKTPFARRIVALDTQHERAMESLRAADTLLAQRGLIGAEAFTAAAKVPVSSWTKNGFTTSMVNVTRDKLVNSATSSAFALGARNAIGAELVMAATLNTNEFLYDTNTAQNMAWSILGVGLGGLGEVFTTGRAMSKFSKSDLLGRFRAEATDPSGMEAMTNVFTSKPKNPNTYLGALGGIYSDEATSLLVQAHTPASDAVSQTTYNKLYLARIAQAQQSIDKVLQKGILFDSGSRTMFKKGQEITDAGNAINQAILREPGAMLGVEMAGMVPEGHTFKSFVAETNTKITTRIEELQGKLKIEDLPESTKVETLKELKQLNFAKKTAPAVLIDGEVLPANHASVYDNWIEPEIVATKQGDATMFSAKDIDGKPIGIEVDDMLNPLIANGKTFDKLSHSGKLSYFRVMREAAMEVVKKANKSSGYKLTLPDNAHWTQLDAVEFILEQTNGQAKVSVSGLTREQAIVESFAQKVDELRLSRTNEDGGLLGENGPLLRAQYNLPRLTSYEMGLFGTQKSAIDIVTMGATKTMTGEQIRAMSLSSIKQAIAKTKHISDLTATTAKDIKSLSGNAFTFLKDENGKNLVPVMLYKRSLKPHNWVKSDLAERIAVKKIQQVNVLRTAGGAPMVQNLVKALLDSSDIIKAAEVSKLADTQLQMNVPGLQNVAPTSAVGTVARELNPFATSAFVNRNNPVMQAIIRLRSSTDTFVRGWMKNSIESAFSDKLNLLAGPANTSSRMLLDQFHTPGVSSGWDLQEELITHTVNGKQLHGFVLADTLKNKSRFKQQFGMDMPKGQELIGPNRKPVVLDDLALDIQRRYNQVTGEIINNTNAVLRSNGLREVGNIPYYVAPPELKGKYVSYVVGPDGKGAIQGGTVIANTDSLRKQAISRMEADPNSIANRPGHVIRTREEITAFTSLVDRAQLELIDPGTIETAGGKGSLGKLGAPEMKAGSFQQSLSQLHTSFQDQGNLIIETLLQDEIRAASARAQVAAGTAWFSDIQFKSIYDMWLNEVHGKSKIAPNSSIIGKAYSTVETTFNSIMSEVAPSASKLFGATTDFLVKRTPSFMGLGGRADVEQFNKLSSHLGKYMPFDDIDEMIRIKSNGAESLNLGKITSNVASFTASMMLRVAEVAHPIMNMAGILNATPSVVRNFTQQSFETAEEFASRVGHNASIFTSGDKTFATLDMLKLAKNGFQRAWKLSPDDPFTNYAINHGMVTQEVAEMFRQFNAAESTSAVKAFFLGDPKSTNKFTKKGVVGWASILSDKSEDLSRAWAHHIGLELADQMGIKSVATANNFAHDVANSMIANYNPRNRSEIFQGSIGGSLGLFQSFMVNYWQRMFSYIENAEYRTAATQMAMQAGLFGLVTVPGFNELNQLIYNSNDGKADLKDGIFQNFGLSTGDLIAGGTLSNLPKLFGAEAVDLYSRGDVQIRSPIFEGIDSMPAVSLFSKIKQGMGDAVGLFSDKNPQLTTAQVAEVLSNTIPNRPISGMIETFLAGGKDTDSYSSLVTENLSAMEAAYRVIGLRSMRQSKEVDAYYSNKEMKEIDAAHDEVLREATRQLLRSGDTSKMPEIFETYVQAGNNPANFRRWFVDQFNSATNTKAQIQLKDLMNDPNMQDLVDRLSAAEVTVFDEESERDPSFDFPEIAEYGQTVDNTEF